MMKFGKFKYIAILATLLLTAGMEAWGLNYTWTGSSNTDWAEPNNWNEDLSGLPDGFSPGAGDSATISAVGFGVPTTNIPVTLINLTVQDNWNTGTLTTLTGDLTVTAGTLTLDGNLETTANAIFSTVVGAGNSLTIGNNATFNNTVTGLTSLTVTGASTINTTNITSSGTQLYTGNVTLGANAVLTGPTVTFNGTVSGATTFSLNVTGDAVFGNGAADTVTGLTSLTVTGASTINTTNITSSGTQLYTGNVTLGANAVLTGPTVTFNGTVSGATTFSLNVTGDAVFGNGAADTVTGLTTLTVTGASTINTTNITSSGTQLYTGNVTLGANAVLTGPTVTFNGTVSGATTFSLNVTGGAVFGNGAADTVTGLTSLTVTGASTINTTNITSSGTQLYTGNVTLGANAVLTGPIVTFNGTVSGATTFSLNVTGDAVFGNGAADTVTGLTTLTVTGASTINTTNITSSGTQLYTGNVTLGANAVLTGPTVTFNGTVSGATTFSLNVTGDAVFGNGAADTVTGLTTLTVTGASTINTTNITSSGTQLYTGNVTLGANAVLTGPTVTFNGTVSGATTFSLNVTGDAVFGNGAADTVTGLTSLTVTGASTINTTNITSSGTQLYTGNVTLGANAVLTGPTVTFNGTVSGATTFSLNVTGDAVFGNGAADTVTGLTTLTVTGASTINTTNITSSGTQLYTGNVTLGANAVLTGPTVTFNGTVSGATTFSLNVTGGAVFGNGAADTVTGLTSLTVTGASTINTTNITSSGTQLYTGNVTLGANAVLTGPIVTFNGTVSGATTFSLNVTGDAVFGNGAADTVTGLTTLTVTGASTINTTNITSSGTQLYTGNVTLGANAVLTGPTVTFNGTVSGATTFSLNVTGDAVFGNGAADTVTGLTSLTVTGASTINTTNITSSGTQLYTGNVTLGANAVLTGPTVTFNGTVSGATTFSLNVTGGAVFGNGAADTVTGLTTLTVTGASTINTTNITSSGTQLYTGNVTLGANAVLTGPTVTFNGTVSGATTFSLNVTGDAVFGNGAADTVTGLTSLTVTGASTINTTNITSSGTQLYTGNVTLGANAVLTGPTVTFNGTVSGATTFSLNVTGDAVFGNGAADTVTGLTTLTVTGASTINTTNITSSGTQLYTGNVTLGANAVLTGPTVTFNGTVSGATTFSLNVTGDAVFGNGAADTVTGLTSLTVTGASTINTTNITSSGTQLYTGNVTLGANAVLTGPTVTFNGTVSGATTFSLNVTGDAVFGNGAADTVTGLTTLTVTGASTINTTNITSSGTQLYTGNVTLGANAVLTGPTVTFNGTVSGATTFSLNVTGDAVFGNGAADTVTGLTSLTVTGASTINTTNITSSGTQLYTGNVTLGANAVLTGPTVTFNGTVSGATTFSLNVTGDAVFGNGAADTVTGLTTLTVTGASTINTTNITSSGTQLYTGNVTLGANAVLTGPTVTFNGTVSGATTFSLNVTGDAVFGNGAADTVTGLTSLTVTGASTINTTNITSSGTQLYTGNVTLGANAVLTGPTVTFNGTVSGATTFSLNVTGDAVFGNGAADTVTGLTTLTVTGASTINTTNITSSGTQLYTGNVTLGANAVLTGPTVTFNGTVSGATTFSLNVTGDAVFGNGAADTVTGLTSLTVTGASTINTTNITSSGTQLYTGNVTLGTNATLTTTNSTITFGNTLACGAQYLTITAGTGEVQFNGNVTGTSGLANIRLFSAGNLTGAGLNTMGNIDVYIDAPTYTLTLLTNLTCRNLYFYQGNLNLATRTITTGTMAIFGAGYSSDDTQWTGVDTRYAYYAPATGLAYAPPLSTNPAPAAGVFIPGAHSAAFTNLTGTTFNLTGNFYNNGSNMNTGAFTLTIPNNDASVWVFNSTNVATANQWGTPYAVALNMNVTGATAAGGWVNAATAQDVTGSGTNWQFDSPTIAAAETWYDDVIRVDFDMNIENSNGEINSVITTAWASLAAGGVWFDSTETARRFDGVFSNADCTTVLPNNADTDIFYIRTAATQRWNTDATGLSEGAIESTDRHGVHQTGIPDLSFLKGLFRAANGKTMSPHYGAHGEPVYSATADRCRPVVVEVRTGQELHETVQANQRPYDAHNFIEFRWSEPVDIGDFDTQGAAPNFPIPYTRSQTTFGTATEWGGAISGSNPLVVTGYASIATGALATGNRGNYAAGLGNAANDPTVQALYRNFSIDGVAIAADQDHRLRIAIAGLAEETLITHVESWKWYYQGYIDNATTPSGTVTIPSNQYILDRADTPNILEPTIYNLATETATLSTAWGNFDSAAGGRQKPALTINSTTTDLYSTWDTTPPAFAGVKPVSAAWDTVPDTVEVLPLNNGSGLIDRLELHFLDNAPLYNNFETFRWQSRTGWWENPPRTYLASPGAAAPETFGGSRPQGGATRTHGGIRASSLHDLTETALIITNEGADAVISSFTFSVSSPFMTAGAGPLTGPDTPYFTVNIPATWPIATALPTIEYSQAGGGFITDLAGNRMPSSIERDTLNRTPPQPVMALTAAGGSDLYLLFSKPIDTYSPLGIELQLQNPPATVTASAVGISPGSNGRGLLFRLNNPIAVGQILDTGSLIDFPADPVQVPNPDTGALESVTYFSDAAGNFLLPTTYPRVTDLGINIVTGLSASDGVNQDGLLGEGAGALRVFDGSGRLLDRTVTVYGVLETAGIIEPVNLFYDVSPEPETLPQPFNAAAGRNSSLWLPGALSGFNSQGNGEARALEPVYSVNTATHLLRNFHIPDSDSEIVPGAMVEMVFRIGNLFCVRLDTPGDLTSVAPWRFGISETKRQRGGVTIFNNVINASSRERTSIQVDLPRSGNIVIQIFTLDGNLIRVLERGRLGGGTYTYNWDGSNEAGNPVARGIYFIRVVGPEIDEIRKVMVIRE